MSTSNIGSAAPDSTGGFQKTRYTNETSRFCCSSLKAKKIAASVAFGVLATAGATVAGVVPLDLTSLSIVLGATVICAIASAVFARGARRENSETVQQRTADFTPVAGPKDTLSEAIQQITADALSAPVPGDTLPETVQQRTADSSSAPVPGDTLSETVQQKTTDSPSVPGPRSTFPETVQQRTADSSSAPVPGDTLPDTVQQKTTDSPPVPGPRSTFPETVQQRTADFPSVPGPRDTLVVQGRTIEFETAFRKDCDRSPDAFLLQTPQGPKSVRVFFKSQFEDYERKMQEAGDNEDLKEEAKEELKDAIMKGFLEYLIKELGRDREHLIPEITALFSQNLQIAMNGIKDTLGSQILSKRHEMELWILLHGDNIEYTSTLVIPETGPVQIIVQGTGDINRVLLPMASQSIPYHQPRPFNGKATFTIGLDETTHMDSRISLTI